MTAQDFDKVNYVFGMGFFDGVPDENPWKREATPPPQGVPKKPGHPGRKESEDEDEEQTRKQPRKTPAEEEEEEHGGGISWNDRDLTIIAYQSAENSF